jgi:hypothetical protein
MEKLFDMIDNKLENFKLQIDEHFDQQEQRFIEITDRSDCILFSMI